MRVANSIDLASVAEDHAVCVAGCRSEWTQRSSSKAKCSQTVPRIKNMKGVQMVSMRAFTWKVFEEGVIPARISRHNAMVMTPSTFEEIHTSGCGWNQ